MVTPLLFYSELVGKPPKLGCKVVENESGTLALLSGSAGKNVREVSEISTMLTTLAADHSSCLSATLDRDSVMGPGKHVSLGFLATPNP